MKRLTIVIICVGVAFGFGVANSFWNPFAKKAIEQIEANPNAVGVDFYTVEWVSFHGSYSIYDHRIFRVFINENEANSFKKAIEEAYVTLGVTAEDCKVTITKNRKP